MELEVTKKVLAALEREGVRYIVFGAVAINLLGTLYRMKKGTIRPKDWGDAEALRRRFKLEDG